MMALKANVKLKQTLFFLIFSEGRETVDWEQTA